MSVPVTCMVTSVLLVLSQSLYLVQLLLQVQRHLPKLFDNLAKMKFQLDSEQKPTKVGLGMYSREEEYVSFSEPCDCSGQVRGKTLSIKTVQRSLLSRPLCGHLVSSLCRASLLCPYA